MASVVWNKTAGDEETSVNDMCRQQSSVLLSNMNDRENFDENEDDVVRSPLSRHSHDVDHKIFSGAGDVISVQQIDDDTET